MLSVPNLPIASVLASEPKGDTLSNSVEKSLLLSITFAVQSAITVKYRVRETKTRTYVTSTMQMPVLFPMYLIYYYVMPMSSVEIFRNYKGI